MPSNTLVASYTLNNLGPLTTTFTAAPSCSTWYRDVWIGQNYTYADTDYSSQSVFFEPAGGLCGPVTSIGGCLPSGSALDAQYDSWTKAGSNPQLNTFDYYSPGLFCPSGYATVGLATKADDGSVTTSGEGFSYPWPTQTTSSYDAVETYDLTDPPANAFLEALGPGETAVMCCPSGYDATTNALYGYCTSVLPSYPIPTTVCVDIVTEGNGTEEAVNTTLTLFGSTITGQVESYTVTTEPFSSVTETLGGTGALPWEIPSASGTYVAVTVADVLWLAHKASDVSSAGESGAAAGAERAGLSVIIVLCALVGAFTSGFLLVL